MREYEKDEIIREKCHWCGCKNKMYTDLMNGKMIIGKTIRCCNCGEVRVHIDPTNDIPMQLYLSGKYYRGKSKCIQESFCSNDKCSLYGSCTNERPIPPNEDINVSEGELMVDTINQKKFR